MAELTEADLRSIAGMRTRVAVRAKLELQIFEVLARVANVDARRAWQGVSDVDPES